MICNGETKRAMGKIAGFVRGSDRKEFVVRMLISAPVSKISIISTDGEDGAMVRWERGKGWRSCGTGRGGNDESWYPVLK